MLLELLSFFGVESPVSVPLVDLLNKILKILEISKIKQSKVTHWLHGKVQSLGEICSIFETCLSVLYFSGKQHFIFEFDDSTH